MVDNLTQRQDIDVKAFAGELNLLEGLQAPRSKPQTRAFMKGVSNATLSDPITLYVGSCPDYSYTGGKYDHQSLRDGVPLLSQIHLHSDRPIIDLLEKYKVPYRYVLMVADVEAIDDVFSERYTDSDKQKFLELCTRSAVATGEIMATIPSNGEMVSSSFFQEFGMDTFLQIQQAYQEILSHRFEEDSSFHFRVVSDMMQRRDLYNKVYKSVLPTMTPTERNDFLIKRTIRTMAQYLTLGRLAAEKTKFPVFINHPTTNVGLYNDRNKFTLPGDGPQPQPTIPIFELKQGVY